MAFSKIFTGSILGIEAKLVEVETNLDNRGFPGFTIVGLPGKEIDEARERVKSAIKNSGYKFPDKKITVNLAPADLHKRGSLYDLPIAVGILSVAGVLSSGCLKTCYVVGELSLNGSIYKINGLVPLVLEAVKTFEKIIIPMDSLLEVYDIAPGKIFGFSNLKSVVDFLVNGTVDISKPQKQALRSNEHDLEEAVFSKIKGQDFAKRAVQIAAAGGHNIALFGSPGTGKSLLIKAMQELMPTLSKDELYEVAKIHSVVGLVFGWHNLNRPFRNPHHTITRPGMIGGGNPVLPGEISLAHNGILFLDEFTEFSRGVIESLRVPIEEKRVCLSRTTGAIYFPCRFILAVAFNPCPCGNYGNPQKVCTCAEHQIKKYRSKLSGPILDRIDIFVNCRTFDLNLLSSTTNEIEEDLVLRDFKNQINGAVEIQRKRYQSLEHVFFNRDLQFNSLHKFISLSAEAKEALNMCAAKLGLSPRGYHRLGKVARTIADLDLEVEVMKRHVLEAAQYMTKF